MPGPVGRSLEQPALLIQAPAGAADILQTAHPDQAAPA